MRVFALVLVHYHTWQLRVQFMRIMKVIMTIERKSELWNVHVQVMLKVISFSILNMHELVETWLPET